jgi:hypothetical protein
VPLDVNALNVDIMSISGHKVRASWRAGEPAASLGFDAAPPSSRFMAPRAWGPSTCAAARVCGWTQSSTAAVKSAACGVALWRRR